MGVTVKEKIPGSGVWWVFISYQGRRRSKKIGSKKVAREVAEKIKAKLVLGDFDMDTSRPGPSFGEYSEKCLAMPRNWKDSTRETYRYNLETYVYPEFKDARINQISRAQWKEFFHRLLEKGIKPNTVGLIKASVNMVLSEAFDDEIVKRNPVSDIHLRLERRRTIEVKPLTEAEVSQLLEAAAGYMGGKYYPVLLCALRTGLRVGELQALKPSDLDSGNRIIEVKRSWRKDRLTDTKNRRNRQVDMTPHLAETLRTQLVDRKKAALRAGQLVPEWLFVNDKGKMLHREALRNALARCLRAANLRHIRIHDLRHTYATIRLMKGHNVGDVSYQLGHSSISITYDIYGSWIPGHFKTEVDSLDNDVSGCT